MTPVAPVSSTNLGPQRRLRAIGAVVLLHVVIAYGFLFGLGLPKVSRITETLTTVRLLPPPPADDSGGKRSDTPAPAARRADPAPVEAPPPVKLVVPPPPALAAPVAGNGLAARAGASDDDGPGSGAGGDGLGGGGDGDGDGATHSEHVAGRIKASDYPRELREAGIGGTVVARVDVGRDGRVTRCTVTQSSGSDALDDLTCDLIYRRYRYDPGRDASGRPVADDWIEEHEWTASRERGVE